MPVETTGEPVTLLEASEIEEEDRDDFAYMDWDALDAGRDSATFFQYKGRMYDYATLEDNDAQSGITGGGYIWDKFMPDSYYSGIVVHETPIDGEIIVGSYYES